MDNNKTNAHPTNTANVITFQQKNKKEVKYNPYYLGCKPKGVFPRGTIPAVRVKVDMAVGMYQFHSLLACHQDPVTKEHLIENHDDTNDNILDMGFINY